jgi:LmbE family N-acetylglucosaminyl deacetylase/SAM-dependent methyltransferase
VRVAPTFTAERAGTPESVWTEVWLPGLPETTLRDDTSRLVVLAPHPDDETLGAGALIALAARRGVDVHVVIASDGEASHPRSRTHDRARLAGLRRAEVAGALHLLAPRATVEFLGLPDSALAGCAEQIAEALDRHVVAGAVVVTTWEHDRHPDHAACARAGGRVARARAVSWWQCPIWAWHWGTPDSPEFVTSDVRRVTLDPSLQRIKAEALLAHRSQIGPLSDEPGDEAVIGPGVLDHFRRACEVFVIHEPAPATSAAYFDDLYRQAPDPWGLADRFYERRKRDLLVASLPRDRFRRAFEPGCATGLLTAILADRCDEVVAWDVAQRAVDQAIARTATAPGRVVIERGAVPQQWPAGSFDLVVVSEVGYYCTDPARLRARVDASLADGGVLIACHWRHPAADHPVSAEQVHVELGRGRRSVGHHEEQDFFLDVWSTDGDSVATREGIIR